MKAVISENKLSHIIVNSIKIALNERKVFPIDPTALAQQLFENGTDFKEFVRRLSDAYELISPVRYNNDASHYTTGMPPMGGCETDAESYSKSANNAKETNAARALIRAIKNAKTFYDYTDGMTGYEAGFAKLSTPISLDGKMYAEIGYGLENASEWDRTYYASLDDNTIFYLFGYQVPKGNEDDDYAFIIRVPSQQTMQRITKLIV